MTQGMARHAGKDPAELQRLLDGYRVEADDLERKIGKKPYWSQSEKWPRRSERLDELKTVLIPRIKGALAVPA